MKVTVAYVAVTQGPRTGEFCARFVGSWQRYPPQYPCELIVCANGGPLPYDVGRLFDPLGAKMYPRPNVGADIGAYADVANNFDCDLLVCLGESVYFHREGWLARFAHAYSVYGHGMFGAFANNNVRPHLVTTAFAVYPKLIVGISSNITKEGRMNFEHGPHPFWKQVEKLGLAVRLVTFSGDYGPREWRTPRNGMWKGDQSDCLVFANHTDRYVEAREETKRMWERNSDRVGR